VFLGRRKEITEDIKPKLRRYVHDHRPILRLHTLDWLAGAALSVVGLLNEGRGCWPVPMRALSHSDLAAGLPAAARDWIQHKAPETCSAFIEKARRDDRDAACRRMSEFDDDQ
jgi:hypothetical protein